MPDDGGRRVARVLSNRGVRFLFTLCGGHISPILVAAKSLGIRVVDVRHEATAVFAADATARLTGVPGVAAVTAGPGCTNTLTAVKNAALAQSPVVVLGGATATVLRGRGSLQDIDQLALFRPHVKNASRVKRVRDLAAAVAGALDLAADGVPGPVFVELPVDLLYPEPVVRDWYAPRLRAGPSAPLSARMTAGLLKRHLDAVFRPGDGPAPVAAASPPAVPGRALARARALLARAERPLLLAGSSVADDPARVHQVAAAVERLGVPVYLAGMARGLLGRDNPLQLRHRRREALREADVVVLAGVPCDFRLDYGSHLRRARTIAAHRSRRDLYLNRRPTVAVRAGPGRFLEALASAGPPCATLAPDWLAALKGRDEEREAEIAGMAKERVEHVHPIRLLSAIERRLAEGCTIVADGGDFVGTAAYVLRPRGPLSWLDPGPFGTLGVGAGFALAAGLCRPGSTVWLVWGDGSAGFGLAEFDTFVRLGVPVVAVVGNDASWAQIARGQVEALEDDVGTVLRRSDYHVVAEGLGGRGFLLRDAADVDAVLDRATGAAAQGSPVLVNAWLGETSFRKGSLSI